MSSCAPRWILFLVGYLLALSEAKQPHIILVVADDLGYNDVSWHNSDIISPHLATLAANGTLLEQNYVLPICSPTRSALMTGYYPIHTGRQSSVIWQQEPVGLFTNFTILPQYLNELGYHSHAVGKWHLGFCHESYLPTQRGFKTFNGYFTGSESYFTHLRSPSVGGGAPGYDFHHNEDPDFSANGTYSSLVFMAHAQKVIRDHSKKHPDEPLFLYLPFQSVHSPLEVPEYYRNLYPIEMNEPRRTYSGMVTALDDAVGNITQTLREHHLLENSIIVFTSDNGGQTMAGGSNSPLRGNKGTLWEGGTRVAGFVHIPFSKKKASGLKSLFHVTDWLPTLYAAAGGDPKALGPIDGVNQWDLLVGSTPIRAPRTEFLYNIQPIPYIEGSHARAAIRVGDMKLLRGPPGSPSGWIPASSSLNIPEGDQSSLLQMLTGFDALEFPGCQNNPHTILRLFNITQDPEERLDLALTQPHVVKTMLKRLAEYEVAMIPPNIADEVDAGNPNHFGGVYTSGWCQAQP